MTHARIHPASDLPEPPAPAPARRRLRVRHVTRYTYDQPILRSQHRLHLRPVHDWRQTVLSHDLSVQPAVGMTDFEDVFGNWTTAFELKNPYSELLIAADSLVELVHVDPFDFHKPPDRSTFPLIWMPWERQILTPFMTTPELPESQLQALADYARSFVERNGRDLIETLFAINLTLYHDYEFVRGSTCLATSPFEVFATRRGVCQDFTNLFICLTRLLGVPSRYVCGYVYTGSSETDPAARAHSDATHAWVEVYLPKIGWMGFDPTNGLLPEVDHIRVSRGREFRDTSPTSGSLFGPVRHETMNYHITIEDVTATGPTDAAQPAAASS